MNQKKLYFQGNIAHACVHNDIYLTIPQQRQLVKRATLTTKKWFTKSSSIAGFLLASTHNFMHFYWLAVRLTKRLSIGIFTPVSGLSAHWKSGNFALVAI